MADLTQLHRVLIGLGVLIFVEGFLLPASGGPAVQLLVTDMDRWSVWAQLAFAAVGIPMMLMATNVLSDADSEYIDRIYYRDEEALVKKGAKVMIGREYSNRD